MQVKQSLEVSMVGATQFLRRSESVDEPIDRYLQELG